VLQSILSWPEFTHWFGEPAGFILSDLRDRHHDAPSSKSAVLATAEAGYHFIRPNWRLPSAPAFQNPRTAEEPKN
jgi:hypothetical protein